MSPHATLLVTTVGLIEFKLTSTFVVPAASHPDFLPFSSFTLSLYIRKSVDPALNLKRVVPLTNPQILLMFPLQKFYLLLRLSLLKLYESEHLPQVFPKS